jgi:hypothetical protein
MTTFKKPLSNLQVELLKAFQHDLSDEDILALRQLLSDFFAQRSIEAANKVWDEQGWNDEKIETLLKTKLRRRSNAT